MLGNINNFLTLLRLKFIYRMLNYMEHDSMLYIPIKCQSSFIPLSYWLIEDDVMVDKFDKYLQ